MSLVMANSASFLFEKKFTLLSQKDKNNYLCWTDSLFNSYICEHISTEKDEIQNRMSVWIPSSTWWCRIGKAKANSILISFAPLTCISFVLYCCMLTKLHPFKTVIPMDANTFIKSRLALILINDKYKTTKYHSELLPSVI